MNKPRLIILLMLLLLSVMGQVVTAQTTDRARDFLFIGIDPRTENSARNSELYLIRSDGSRVTNLTNTEFDSENHAFWSADGMHLYFSRNGVAVYPGSDEGQSSTSFYLMDISDAGEKSDERLLFHLSDVMKKPMRTEYWTLSPDEQEIAFMTDDVSLDLYTVQIDGSDLHKIAPDNFISTIGSVIWSPDGTELAFRNVVCAGNSTPCVTPYWIMDAKIAGTPKRIGEDDKLWTRWTPHDTFVAKYILDFEVIRDGKSLLRTEGFMPDLSPAKSLVAYAFSGGGQNDDTLLTVDLDNSSLPNTLTSALSGEILNIKWSPDSKQIAFYVHLNNTDTIDVYVVNADGTGLTKLLNRHTYDFPPLAWRPDTPTKDG